MSNKANCNPSLFLFNIFLSLSHTKLISILMIKHIFKSKREGEFNNSFLWLNIQLISMARLKSLQILHLPPINPIISGELNNEI